MSESSAYARAGVDYDVLDAAKRLAMEAATETSAYAGGRGALLADASRGEPASVIELGPTRLGFVLECLGTKSVIASEYEAASGEDHYAEIGYDTVAAAVNDCICVGALPISVNAYFATGSATFYTGGRHRSLVAGFQRGCRDAGASWGGGESPTLSGLISPTGIDLAAACIGLVPEGMQPLYGGALAPGDEIVLVGSSGLHANGASLARGLAATLDGGLLFPLPSGESFGEALLRASVIYVDLVAAVLSASLPLHYASHITGHGLRKVMRADRDLTYRIATLPPTPPVLAFLVERLFMSEDEAYATFNMGAGFALYVAAGAGEAVVGLAAELGHEALVAGTVEKGERRVVLEPVGVVYGGDSLALR